MQLFTSLFVGLLFGIGLIVSGMANPAKVLGFLDLTGTWDPSLAFVMGGAILVGTFAFARAKRMSKSACGAPIQLPMNKQIDKRLVLGSLAFGAGWGLAGFCPGPALVAFGAGEMKAWIFIAAMLVGMLGFQWLNQPKTNAARLVNARKSVH